jgi:hypothetical protein
VEERLRDDAGGLVVEAGVDGGDSVGGRACLGVTHWRRQGDGELSAIEWFVSKGADVYLPLGHSPDADFVAELDGRLLRMQVKTSTCYIRERWSVTLATRGGNRSWNGEVKRLDRARFDRVFVVVGDGRRWWFPSDAVEAGSGMLLGGPKYAAFEVERGAVLRLQSAAA